MTREEAINNLIRIRQQQGESEAHEALGMAIDALAYQAELPDGLEEAAERWCKENGRGFVLRDKAAYYIGETLPAFIAGAKWDRAKMMEKAVEGVVQYDGQFINLGDERYIDLNPTIGLKPVFELNDGDKVKVIIIPEE